MKVLELDAGNTFIKWRIRQPQSLGSIERCLTSDVKNNVIQVPPVWQEVNQAKYVSVAGADVNGWLQQCFSERDIPCHSANVFAEQQGLKNAYKVPEQMGADRWVAMLAAWKQYQTSFCLVDAGSAITIDWVDQTGQHLGGYILPGLQMLKTSLLGQTAEVRWVEDDKTRAIDPGSSTGACVEQGCLYQLAALMHQIDVDIERRHCQRLLLTGGDAEILSSWSRHAEWVPTLLLDGLQYMEMT